MDFANSLLQLVSNLWGLASKPLGYICDLKDIVEALKKETRDLEAMNEDVKATVEREEAEARVRRTNQVKNWLDEVQVFIGGVDQVLQDAGERDQIKCLARRLPRNCWSSYKLGKKVDQLLNEAGKLQRKRELGNYTSPLPPPSVIPMPVDDTMGLDMSLNKVWKWLMDREKKNRVIGLYGTGGVGKTTLMKRINNKFLSANHGFEVVIWVVVSKQLNEDNIRHAIGERLNIQDKSVHSLLEVLTHKKFVLLIDDVWEWLDLSKIGVPRAGLENGSKIVLTTRLMQVCDQMNADQKCEVQCLMPEEALTLFKQSVGKVLENCPQKIQDLAEDIVVECNRLPLALITVGRAMASKNDLCDWRHALTTLRHKPHELEDMVEKVFNILKFSYDSLDGATQACFLYCCHFPEDYHIIADELIELWIGEGLLGNTNIYDMRDQGASILGNLKRACLLESGLYSLGQPTVKMHDIIHDMATWIARDHGQKENKLLVIENEEDMSMEMMSKLVKAEKVSLCGELTGNINQTPPMCSQLETLFVRKTNVGFLPRGFFKSMACLKVLDLSGNTNIKLFPEEICDLINLWYLNISDTCISELPKEIKNLTRLRSLLLNGISNNVLIPTGVIASLPLNVFSMWESGLEKEEEVVEELGGMHKMIDLSIVVYKSSSALKIFQSLHNCIRRVKIMDCEFSMCIPISHSLKERVEFLHLEVLYLQRCSMHVKMEITQGMGRVCNYSCFPSLIEVSVERCGFSDLSWLVHAPKLQKLKVWSYDSIEKIIGDGIAGEELATSRLFSHLEFLNIGFLSKLRSICGHTLFFTRGANINIYICPSLKKLPWDSSNARESFSVNGSKGWWAGFEWDPTARVTFQWRDEGSVEEEMTFGEAVRKMNDKSNWNPTIGFRPSGPSE
ncbi:hypothetical protein ACJRO7_026012 [Eucalyptus globulus]|uniref:AAA+ ATPase domain-containing protein n=1 Tax=Eucalyptus globulus TaxID=34317 RepID=A0ABD3KB17_EUCGL